MAATAPLAVSSSQPAGVQLATPLGTQQVVTAPIEWHFLVFETFVYPGLQLPAPGIAQQSESILPFSRQTFPEGCMAHEPQWSTTQLDWCEPAWFLQQSQLQQPAQAMAMLAHSRTNRSMPSAEIPEKSPQD